jgi:hypothetical protein
MAGGIAFRLRKESSAMDESIGKLISLFANLLVMNKEHNDKAALKKNKMVKLKLLIMNIPKEGAKAKAKLKAR